MAALPTNIDTSYPNDQTEVSVQVHQYHHDELHNGHNLNETHRAAASPHGGHETPAGATAKVDAHAAGVDPHTGYQKETEKDVALGYPGLSAAGFVVPAQLGSGTRDGTRFLRDDGTWQVVATGGAAYATVQDEGTARTQRPTLNFIGSMAEATDDVPNLRTNVTFTDPVPAHAAAADPHAGYRLESVAIAAADVAGDIATQAELDAHVAGSHATHVLGTVRLTVAATAPGSPAVNDVWIDTT